MVHFSLGAAILAPCPRPPNAKRCCSSLVSLCSARACVWCGLRAAAERPMPPTGRRSRDRWRPSIRRATPTWRLAARRGRADDPSIDATPLVTSDRVSRRIRAPDRIRQNGGCASRSAQSLVNRTLCEARCEAFRELRREEIPRPWWIWMWRVRARSKRCRGSAAFSHAASLPTESPTGRSVLSKDSNGFAAWVRVSSRS